MVSPVAGAKATHLQDPVEPVSVDRSREPRASLESRDEPTHGAYYTSVAAPPILGGRQRKQIVIQQFRRCVAPLQRERRSHNSTSSTVDVVPSLDRLPEPPSNSRGLLAFGDRDGFGRFGMLDEDETGLKCHECGWRGAHLGLHTARAHDLAAADYRIKHGLRRSKGLVAATTRETIRGNAKGRYTENGPLANARDLSKANTARMEAARPASAEEAAQRDARMTQMRRNSRTGKVVQCEQCGVLFCPLVSISRRRFCTMSCSNRHIRLTTLARKRAMAAEVPPS